MAFAGGLSRFGSEPWEVRVCGGGLRVLRGGFQGIRI